MRRPAPILLMTLALAACATTPETATDALPMDATGLTTQLATVNDDLDAADGEQPVDLLLRKTAGRLVAGDAVFVQAAELLFGVEQHHRMAQHRQPVRARQPGRPPPSAG